MVVSSASLIELKEVRNEIRGMGLRDCLQESIRSPLFAAAAVELLGFGK